MLFDRSDGPAVVNRVMPRGVEHPSFAEGYTSPGKSGPSVCRLVGGGCDTNTQPTYQRAHLNVCSTTTTPEWASLSMCVRP